MLTRVEAVSRRGNLLNLTLDDLDSGLLVDEIDGLGPVKATITSSDFAQLDGSQFQSSRRENRNIIITISLEPDWSIETVEDLRRRVYDHFMPKSDVELKLYFDNRNTLSIKGMVESAEPEIFSAEPKIVVSIICFDPDFVDYELQLVEGFTSESITATEVYYDGTVEAGFNFGLFVDRNLTDFSIYMNESQMDFSGILQAGDLLNIRTIPGDKFVRLTRTGNESSYLYGISPQSKWLTLEPGNNQFRVYAVGASIPYTMGYINRYGGV